ncbi:hypothetical protein [Clostridium thermobutyricum]|uniref:Uncharacterized protein n=1 Tax=Clostridium thermobutyricum DSM 4928 TaxID=1121339 RepID=A0A1V4SUE9_9CLOT|nr:hypothetical protein [Clostridium thermobutyricum]OPX47527.1 hypothetical protein CLTHE_17860 [Clostridium thermobutyricum DSM 4928]
MMKLKQDSGGEGVLFYILREDYFHILDGARIIQNKNGVKYYAGSQTDFPMLGDNPQLQEYSVMLREAYNVLNTIKQINYIIFYKKASYKNS